MKFSRSYTYIKYEVVMEKVNKDEELGRRDMKPVKVMPSCQVQILTYFTKEFNKGVPLQKLNSFPRYRGFQSR